VAETGLLSPNSWLLDFGCGGGEKGRNFTYVGL